MLPSLQPDDSADRPHPTPWDHYASWLTYRWQRLLASDPPERNVQQFLEAHPSLLPGADGDIGPGGHNGPEYDAVIAEPPLKGIERHRRPDFMWITRSTSLITPICIEIERPGKRWFNKSGTPTSAFAQALDQLTDWKVWFSEPENQLLFRRAYLRDNYNDRQLLPQYVLIFGRRREFERQSGIHEAPDRLQKKRDFMRRTGESFMTFDSLRPREVLRDFATIKLTASGIKLHRIPPSFTSGPTTQDLASVARDPRQAISKTELWTEDRKAYVLERWLYWQDLADNPDSGRTPRAYSHRTGE